MNWVGVTATPQVSNGQVINITEVTDVAPKLSAQLQKFYGDNRKFPRCIRATELTRELSITTGDAAVANSINPNVPYTITATLCDAFNGSGVGAITYTFKNCCLQENGVKAANNKFGEITLMFDSFGDDSVSPDTDPFSFVVAT